MLLSVFSLRDTWPLAFLPNAFMYVLGMILFATMDEEGQSTWCWTGLIYGLHSIVRPYYMEERTGNKYGWAASGMTLYQALTEPYSRESAGTFCNDVRAEGRTAFKALQMEDDIDHDNEDEKDGSKIEKGEAWQDVKIASDGI